MTHDDDIPETEPGGKFGAPCETPTGANLERLFQVCHAAGELGIVTGEPGVGKTTAARRYTRTDRRAYLVTMSPAASALVPCLTRVGECFGVYPAMNGASPWSDAIRRWLRVQPEPPLLLVDEAHHLSDASVEEVRAIFDATEIGLVFIGSPEIRERWTGPRWAQLTSRVFQHLNIVAPEPGDVDAICKQSGVTDRRSLNLLRRTGKLPGGLREVRKVLAVAAVLASPGNPLKFEHVEAAFNDRGASR